MYVCWLYVCNGTECMYVCWIKKEIYYPELLCSDWLFSRLQRVQVSGFLALVWCNPVQCSCLEKWIKIIVNRLNNKLLYRVTFECLLNDCLYVCWLYVCNCTECMYVCWIKKEIYNPEFLCSDWLFWRLQRVQVSVFLALVWCNPVQCSCLEKWIKKLL